MLSINVSTLSFLVIEFQIRLTLPTIILASAQCSSYRVSLLADLLDFLLRRYEEKWGIYNDESRFFRRKPSILLQRCVSYYIQCLTFWAGVIMLHLYKVACIRWDVWLKVDEMMLVLDIWRSERLCFLECGSRYGSHKNRNFYTFMDLIWYSVI